MWITWAPGPGELGDHLSTGTGARRVEHRDIGAARPSSDRAAPRTESVSHLHLRQVGQRGRRRPGRRPRGVDGRRTDAVLPTTPASAAANRPAPP